MPKPTIRPPLHLKTTTKKWWKRVAEAYELEEHHRHLLTLAGEALDRCNEARSILDREGLTFDDRFGQPKSRPEVVIERDSRLAFARLLRELCLDDDEPDAPRIPRMQ